MGPVRVAPVVALYAFIDGSQDFGCLCFPFASPFVIMLFYLEPEKTARAVRGQGNGRRVV